LGRAGEGIAAAALAHPDAIVAMHDHPTTAALAARLRAGLQDAALYARHHAWRTAPTWPPGLRCLLAWRTTGTPCFARCAPR